VNKNNLQAQLAKYSEAIKTRLKRQIKINKTYATGELYDSIDAKEGLDTINVFAADYVGYVEDGRPPGKRPHINDIRTWIKAKRIRSWRDDVKNERQLAFLIARAIGNKGTIKRYGYKGSGFLEQVIEQLRPAMTQDFKEAIAEDIRNNIRKPQNN